MTDIERVLDYVKEQLEECETVLSEWDSGPGSAMMAWVQEAAVWSDLIGWIEQEFDLE